MPKKKLRLVAEWECCGERQVLHRDYLSRLKFSLLPEQLLKAEEHICKFDRG